MLAAALFGSAMALGARHVVVLLPVTVVLLGATVFAWWSAEPLRTRWCATLVLWTGVGLTLWTALSVVPLPSGWLQRLSPQAADVWARCLAPLGRAGPAWATLSLDPVATRVEVLRGVAYALAFVAASRIAARREGVVFLERALAVTAIALAAAALLHPALGAEKVFGVYAPRQDPGARHIAPILNPNVLSEYLNIGLAILLGQALSPRPPWPRSLLAALSLALIGTQVWVASRGGVLATMTAVALVVWASRARGPEERGGIKSLVILGLLMITGVGMAVVASSEAAMGELAQTEVSKLDVVRQAFRVVPRFPVFGVGRGAFESVFPAFRTDPGHLVYTHPENIAAQWATEWGIFMAVAAFVALFIALRPSSAMARSPRAAGACGAIACVAVQNLVDFGSEFPAVVIALAVCAAIVTGGTSGTDESRKLDVWARRPAAIAAIAVIATVLVVVAVLPGWRHELFDDRAALRADALDPAVGRTEFDRQAAAAMLRHPAEPYLPFMGAIRAVRVGDSSLMPWIERTLDRALVYGPAHLLLARWLAPRSPSQARLEYRLTLEQDAALWNYVTSAIDGLVHSYDDATEMFTAVDVGAVSSAVAARLPATARRLDDVDTRTDPDSRTRRAERRATEALTDVLASDEAPWCSGAQRPACLRDALERSSRLLQLAPTRCAGHAIHARLLLEGGDPQRALKDLRAAAEGVADRIACFEELADLAKIAGSDEMETQALDRIVHTGCADDAECVRNLLFVASHEVARGNNRSALAALQRARAKAPVDDTLLEEVAALAAKVDLHAEALRAYQTLATRHPGDPRWQSAIETEKLALMNSSIPH